MENPGPEIKYPPGERINEISSAGIGTEEVMTMASEEKAGKPACLYEFVQGACDWGLADPPPRVLVLKLDEQGEVQRQVFDGSPCDTRGVEALEIYNTGPGLSPEDTVIFYSGAREEDRYDGFGRRQGSHGRGTTISLTYLASLGVPVEIESNYQGHPWIGQTRLMPTTTGRTRVLTVDGEWEEGERNYTIFRILKPPPGIVGSLNRLPQRYLEANPRYKRARLVPVLPKAGTPYTQAVDKGMVELLDAGTVEFEGILPVVFCDKKAVATNSWDYFVLPWAIEGFADATDPSLRVRRGIASDELEGRGSAGCIVTRVLANCEDPEVFERLFRAIDQARKRTSYIQPREATGSILPERTGVKPAVSSAVQKAWVDCYGNAAVTMDPSLERVGGEELVPIRVAGDGLYNFLRACGIRDGADVLKITKKEKVGGLGEVYVDSIPPFAEAFLSLGEVKGAKISVSVSGGEPKIVITFPTDITINGFKSRRPGMEAKVLDILMAATKTPGIGVTSLISQSRGKRTVFDYEQYGFHDRPGIIDHTLKTTEYDASGGSADFEGTQLTLGGQTLAQASRRYETLAARLQKAWETKQAALVRKDKLEKKSRQVQDLEGQRREVLKQLQALAEQKRQQDEELRRLRETREEEQRMIEIFRKNPAAYLAETIWKGLPADKWSRSIRDGYKRLADNLRQFDWKEAFTPRPPHVSRRQLLKGAATVAGVYVGGGLVQTLIGPRLQGVSMPVTAAIPGIELLSGLGLVIYPPDFKVESLYPDIPCDGYFRTGVLDTPTLLLIGSIGWKKSEDNSVAEEIPQIASNQMPKDFMTRVNLVGPALGSPRVPIRAGEKVLAYSGARTQFVRDQRTGEYQARCFGPITFYTAKENEAWRKNPPTETDTAKFLGDLSGLTQDWKDFITQVRDNPDLSSTDKAALALGAWGKKFVYDGSFLLELQYLGTRISDILSHVVNTARGICNVSSAGALSVLREVGVPCRINMGYVNNGSELRNVMSHEWLSIWNGEKWVDVETLGDNIAPGTEENFALAFALAEAVNKLKGDQSEALFGATSSIGTISADERERITNKEAFPDREELDLRKIPDALRTTFEALTGTVLSEEGFKMSAGKLAVAVGASVLGGFALGLAVDRKIHPSGAEQEVKSEVKQTPKEPKKVGSN